MDQKYILKCNILFHSALQKFGVQKTSVYFYTFHKTASTLFADLLLNNAIGLRKVDYANAFYKDEKVEKNIFKKKGFIYGPIRISVSEKSPIYESFVKPLCEKYFIENKQIVFFIRDPRDILVSAYYSFGFTHGFSAVEEIKINEEENRNAMKNKTIDEYALESAEQIVKNFELLHRLNGDCKKSIVLKYEDMVNNWDFFVKNLLKFIKVRENILAELFKQTRPLETENPNAHHRSGKTNQYREKLKPETIQSLNVAFSAILIRYNYPK